MKANVSQVSGIKTIVFGVKMKVSFSQFFFFVCVWVEIGKYQNCSKHMHTNS